MHKNEFNSVEAELREIEDDFASGQMNAFGTDSTKENFVRELRRIADIETQVFYKTCGLLSVSTAEDHLMRAMMVAGAEPVNNSNSNNNNNNSYGGSSNNSDECSTTMAGGRTPGRENNKNNNSNEEDDNNNSNTAGNSMRNENKSSTKMHAGIPPSGSSADSRGNNNKNMMSSGSPLWNADAGFSDKPFQDVSRHFKLLEGEFTVIGEHLRQISKHVLRLNEIAERVRNTGSNLGP